jgi:hypothetical protein
MRGVISPHSQYAFLACCSVKAQGLYYLLSVQVFMRKSTSGPLHLESTHQILGYPILINRRSNAFLVFLCMRKAHSFVVNNGELLNNF